MRRLRGLCSAGDGGAAAACCPLPFCGPETGESSLGFKVLGGKGEKKNSSEVLSAPAPSALAPSTSRCEAVPKGAQRWAGGC